MLDQKLIEEDRDKHALRFLRAIREKLNQQKNDKSE